MILINSKRFGVRHESIQFTALQFTSSVTMGMPILNLCSFNYNMGSYTHSVIVKQQLLAMHYFRHRRHGREPRKQKPLLRGADIQVEGEK